MRIRFPRRSVAFCLAMCCLLGVISSAKPAFAQPRTSGLPPVLRLSGRVVDHGGNPIPDAELFGETWSMTDWRELPVVEGRSGPDGSFALTTGPGTSFHHELWIRASGYAVKCVEAGQFSRTDDNGALKKVALKVATPMRLRFIGPEGRPQAAELIEPEHVRIENTFHSVPPRVREVLGGLTDADGVWQATFLDQSSWMSVRVVSESFGVQVQQNQFRGPRRDYELKLLRVGSIEGRIVMREPARVAGKTVKVQSVVRRPEDEVRIGGLVERADVDFDRGEATAEIDREGRFRIPAIIAGHVSITLTNTPDADWVTEVGKTFELRPDETRDVEVLAVQKVPFRGTILLSDGSPAEGMQIELSSGANWPLVTAATDANGQFQCRVCPGDVSLTAHLPSLGGVPVFHKAGSVSSVTHGVSSNPSTAVAKTLRLPELKLVEGTLVDLSGQAIPSASLEIWQQPKVFHRLSTNADGRFQIYRTDESAFNQFKVSVKGVAKVSREDQGDPLVVRVLE